MTLAHLILIFLISLHAAGNALLAYAPRHLLPAAGGIAIATVFGAILHSRLVGLFDPRQRAKILGSIWVIYAATLLFVLLAVGEGNAGALGGWVQFLCAFQAGFLLFAGGGRGYLGAHQNAFALVCIAALAGGTVAAVALAGYAGLMAFWLVFDHHARAGAPLRRAWGPAILLALLAAGPLAGVFRLLPPQGYEPVARAPGVPVDGSRIAGAYLELVAWTLAGGIVVIVAMRLLGMRFGAGKELTRVHLAARRGSLRRGSAASAVEAVDLPGRRGKVVRLYVRFLAQAAKLGVRRRPDVTPAEFAGRLPAPASPLTEIFMRARYGPEDVSEQDCEAADRAAEETVQSLRK